MGKGVEQQLLDLVGVDPLRLQGNRVADDKKDDDAPDIDQVLNVETVLRRHVEKIEQDHYRRRHDHRRRHIPPECDHDHRQQMDQRDVDDVQMLVQQLTDHRDGCKQRKSDKIVAIFQKGNVHGSLLWKI